MSLSTSAGTRSVDEERLWEDILRIMDGGLSPSDDCEPRRGGGSGGLPLQSGRMVTVYSGASGMEDSNRQLSASS